MISALCLTLALKLSPNFSPHSFSSCRASRQGLLRALFMPFEGMNEKGVAIGIMAVPYVQLPYDPTQKSLNDLAVVRLVLAHAESTEHVVVLIRNYNIRQDTSKRVGWILLSKARFI